MNFSYADLVELSQHYDGKSCEEVSIDRHPQYGKVFRMDLNGTFKDSNACCLVKKCLWGDDSDDACASTNVQCPSEYGTISPETCQEEVAQRDSDGNEVDILKRKHHYFSRRDCCRHKLLLGNLSYDPDTGSGCDSTEPWADACCPKDSPRADAISRGLHVN